MRFVPLKTTTQQDVQALHRIRAQLIKWRTGLANEIRGLLGEYGIVIRKGMLPRSCQFRPRGVSPDNKEVDIHIQCPSELFQQITTRRMALLMLDIVEIGV
jgi:transposase